MKKNKKLKRPVGEKQLKGIQGGTHKGGGGPPPIAWKGGMG